MWDGTDLLIEDYGRKSVGRERNGGYYGFRCKGFLILLDTDCRARSRRASMLYVVNSKKLINKLHFEME